MWHEISEQFWYARNDVHILYVIFTSLMSKRILQVQKDIESIPTRRKLHIIHAHLHNVSTEFFFHGSSCCCCVNMFFFFCFFPMKFVLEWRFRKFIHSIMLSVWVSVNPIFYSSTFLWLYSSLGCSNFFSTIRWSQLWKSIHKQYKIV